MDDLAERAWKHYRVLSNAPPQANSVCNTVLSMIGALRLIDENAQGNDLTADDERTIRELRIGCSSILLDIEKALADFKSHQNSIDGVLSIQSKLLDQVTQLQSFHLTLRRHSQKRITDSLEQIIKLKSEKDQQSSIREWAILSGELQNFGIATTLVEEELFFIDDWLTQYLPSETESACITVEEEDLPPDYTAGPQRQTIAEKVQSLENTSRLMAIDSPIMSVGASSSTEPPPYTFDEGNDQAVDEEFSRLIQRAIEKEANYRYLDREEDPARGPHGYSWLPKSFQLDYKNRRDVITFLDATSFSTMAYETAPRLRKEVERLAALLRIYYDHKKGAAGRDPIVEAFHTIEVLSAATGKFGLFEDWKPKAENLSDLDILDFEQSTATAIYNDIDFPHKEFELAQKTSYRLLTYIMGLLEVLSQIFSSQNYTPVTVKELEILWRRKRMAIRTSWIEKQLAGWGEIEDLVRLCRDWHRVQRGLQAQAITALKEWQEAERIFAPNDRRDNLELMVISATGLPKPNFRTPTAWAKVVCYGENKIDGLVKLMEFKTEVALKSQNPVWNKNFVIIWLKGAKWIDIEIYDRVAGMDSQLGKSRLHYSFIPGVEANFANRSLIYGYDDECEAPFQIISSGKGKEKEPPIVKVGLKWTGREQLVQKAGLPTLPPGKMFRKDYAGIPMSPEERETLRNAGP